MAKTKELIKAYLQSQDGEHVSIDEIAGFYQLNSQQVFFELETLCEEGLADYKYPKNVYKNARQISDRRYFWCGIEEGEK